MPALMTIGEVARRAGIRPSAIRFYEEEGLISPRREGHKRLYTPADRVRVKLILRGKRIGMSLDESAEVIDMYDPEHNNSEQLRSLLDKVSERRQRFLQQRRDIDEMLAGLDEVQQLCEQALAGNGDRISN